MTMPRFVARMNRRLINPANVAGGEWPVLTHIGRSSGSEYRTPLDAHAVAGGFLFFLVYGSRSDWAQNILVAGHAGLTVHGREVALANPRVVTIEAARLLLEPGTKYPPRLARVRELLHMDLADPGPA